METALITALIAAGAAIAAAAISWFGAVRARRATDRNHAWERFTWSVAQREDDRAHDISTTVLHSLAEISWWSKADRRLAKQALRRRTQHRQPTDTTKDSE